MLKAENIYKSFNGKPILEHVNIEMLPGQILGLLGPNGAGKTTIIRVLNQIIAPDAGAVYFNSRPIKFGDQAQMGYLPEDRGLYKKLSVKENLEFFGQLKGLTSYQVQQAIKKLSATLEFDTFLQKKVEDCSKGMQQKIQFAAAILHDPKVVILDEPLSGLDPINAETFIQEILSLRQQGKALMLVTHRMDSVENLCDSLALINNGKVIYAGQMRETKRRFAKDEFLVTVANAEHEFTPDLKVEFVKEAFNGYTYLVSPLYPGVHVQSLFNREFESGQIVSIQPKETQMQEIFKTLVNASPN